MAAHEIQSDEMLYKITFANGVNRTKYVLVKSKTELYEYCAEKSASGLIVQSASEMREDGSVRTERFVNLLKI